MPKPDKVFDKVEVFAAGNISFITFDSWPIHDRLHPTTERIFRFRL